MAPWFERRYPAVEERIDKFKIFLAICDYFDMFRDTLAKGGVITLGRSLKGDAIPGSIITVLLNHFCIEPTPPKPEQVIAATRKRMERTQQRN